MKFSTLPSHKVILHKFQLKINEEAVAGFIMLIQLHYSALPKLATWSLHRMYYLGTLYHKSQKVTKCNSRAILILSWVLGSKPRALTLLTILQGILRMARSLTSSRLLLKHRLLRLHPWIPHLKLCPQCYPWHFPSLFLALFSPSHLYHLMYHIFYFLYIIYIPSMKTGIFYFVLFTVGSLIARSAPSYNKSSINICWMIFWKKIYLHNHIKLNWIWTPEHTDSRTRLLGFKSLYSHLLAVLLGQVI